jgi:hypothetical protein
MLKATDKDRRSGALTGKEMTALENGESWGWFW